MASYNNERDVGFGILHELLENDNIDLDTIQTQIDIMNERKKYLSMHNASIWQGKNGKWYTKLEGKLIKRNDKSSIESYIVEYYKENENCPTFYKCFMEWIEFKLEYGEIQKQTYDRYIHDYNKYIKDSTIDIKFKYMNEDILEDYIRNTIRDLQLTAKAWAKIRLVIIGTFKYAYRKKITNISIKEFLDNLELSPKIFKKRRFTDEESVFTQEEVDMIASYISQKKPSIINYGIMLAFQTGLRVGELSALRWEDIKDGYIRVDKTEVRYTTREGEYVYEVRDNAKTDAGDRNVIFLEDADDTLKHIRKLNPFSEYVFMRNGDRVHAFGFTRKLEKICAELGIVVKSMHKARKTYATRLKVAGIDDKLIIRQLGHTNIGTTDTFYYFNNRTINENKQKLQDALLSS